MVHSNGRGRWGDEEMRRWGVEKTVSRKETEIHALSWSIGYGAGFLAIPPFGKLR
ncbi:MULTISPECIES: hypothetical protein [unclassified Okeania]|uniref:hypothetical protein n=1 Tax=unclassified Okeania TaxID=2634635 RepID=UPI00144EFC63|nr:MULTISPECIES: hypothetical protein [unclassified Okeania]NET79987.1 hypothetical protein [Okeania sp. SIO1F9]